VWLCDGPHRIFEHGERAYSRDFFFFLMAVLLLFGLQSMRSMPANHAKIVNRDQTEEWRGWMQLVFIMYHYYAAKEVSQSLSSSPCFFCSVVECDYSCVMYVDISVSCAVLCCDVM
jgi:hypothetical protein